MIKNVVRKIMYLLIVIAGITGGINEANAGPGGGSFYANSPILHKFIDTLPGLGYANRNNLGQYIPVGIPDTQTYPGSDYYEIGLTEYTQKMHTDLPKATKLRGYSQINTNDPTVKNINQYLGPLIIARKDRPVRIKFDNLLPTGTAGNLFIPVDTSMMGAGMGPLDAQGNPCDPMLPGATCAMYTQNRATLHLHGGNTPWISDGTPHQWIAPVGENTPYKRGASQRNVPDMPDPNGLVDGSATFFWTNQQSSRLMFYHDHAYGLTRLNVYAGEAAGYLVTDQYEEDLISGTNVTGINPNNQKVLPDLGGVYHYGIPLVIQDKTFVPQNIDIQDAAWNFQLVNNPGGPSNQTTNIPRDKTVYPWGAYGDLWFPHVYEANQDPYSPAGANPFGRWDYGPWFWPPVNIDPSKTTIPDPSTTPEAFMDTPIVNGTAYPYLQVAPRAYRFRILNACNDRTLNLQLYYVDPSDPTGTEVKMVPAKFDPTYPADWPTDGRDGGVPDPALRGPNMIQIGSEGGFLPNPVVIPNRPIGYDYNRRNIVVLNTLYRALMLGAAERADVIIDFSSVPPGSKLILYNDGPAPNPAFDTRYDYYTADPDQSTSGGAPSTLVGFGPNTRTIMQFRVTGTASAPFNQSALNTAIPAAFKASQPVPVVPESVFNSVYGKTYTDLYGRIADYFFTFKQLDNTGTPVATPSMIQFRNKAIQELWDPWGRMNATLGVELPFTNNLTQTTIPLGYVDLPTEIVNDGQPQLWKITHNGVDTHPVHFHLFDVQLINRVGWDGAIRPPDDNEYGWKETVRMNPLEDVIVALKPQKQSLPFTLPVSLRAIDPTSPPAPATVSVVVDPYTNGAATAIPNASFNFAYEYVWHCHILGHEENDFMRAMIFQVPSAVPPAPSVLSAIPGGQTIGGVTNAVTNQVVLTWTDNSSNAADFLVERRTGNGAYQPLTTLSFIPTVSPSYTDTTLNKNTSYTYRVSAFNSMGSSIGSPTVTLVMPTWSSATNVTITPNRTTPHIVGSNVIMTAQGVGASAGVAYQYRFWLTGTNPVSPKTLVQDWSLDNTWSLPDTTSVGDYVITVDVRTTASNTPEVSNTLVYQIIPPPVPIVNADPVPGIYAVTQNVTLSANVPSNIYYTTDGTAPTPLSTKYTVPIALAVTTTLNYIAFDAVTGFASAVQTGTWQIAPLDMTASVLINNAPTAVNTTSVTLNMTASDPAGVATMSFSNDNITYTAEQPYPNGGGAASYPWTLAAGSDGVRTVYIKFRDASVGGGNVYGPYTASVTLDTIPPVTTASPAAGTYAAQQLSVSLIANESTTIYYTLDGSDPTVVANPSRLTYTAPILLNGSTNTVKYYAVDIAGNVESVHTGTWILGGSPLTATVSINSGATATNNTNVSLTMTASISTPGLSVSTMAFSNDGITYSQPAIAYTTNPVAWQITAGDGQKTVYVQFTDNAQPPTTYAPIVASIMMDTAAPVTTPTPVPGTYSTLPTPVTLAANEPATIYYTLDNSDPTVVGPSRLTYNAPISVVATTTIRYYAIDTAGNAETPQSSTWTINGNDLVASVIINNGALYTNNATVNLDLSAVDPAGITNMQFSNDGVTYSAPEAYATTKSWTLDNTSNGLKTVYVKFQENTLGTPWYPPVTAAITLDTVAPVTTASPIPGEYANLPIFVTLAADEVATIKYTTDGTDPSASGTAQIYTAPIPVGGTTTIKYYAIDLAGNVEASVNTGTWIAEVVDMVSSILINNGNAVTNNTNVTLTLSATDPQGVATMQFSNDGITFTAEEPYATSKAWVIPAGDGLKTVYVKFRDNSGNGGFLYPPISASITLDTVAPVTTASPIPGDYSAVPITVTLAANETSTIYYSLDGSFPAAVYTGPLTLNADTTIRYYSVDAAGNSEAVRAGTWTVHTADMAATVQINSGSLYTNNTTVALTLNATDPIGIDTMSFSNDGLGYSAEEPYNVSKTWSLAPGDGLKTVYVRFRDQSLPSGFLYPPVTASITLDTTPPTILVAPASMIPSSFATRTITGTKEAGATLTLDSVANGASGVLTATTGGTSWSLSLSNLPAPPSSTNFTLISVDPAGNSSTLGASVSRIATPPDPPTMGRAVAGNGLAVVMFAIPLVDGGSPITGYTVISSPGGIVGTGLTSPITVPGLTNGTPYTFTVTATNAIGTSGLSVVSNSVTPAVSTPPTVTITANARPASPSNLASGQIGFSGVNAFSFQCKLDNGSYASCTSPYSYNGLADGTAHTFFVQAFNTDNPAVASAVAIYVWTVDLTPPSVTAFHVSVPAPALTNTQSIAIKTFTATDNAGGSGLGGYLITENSNPPAVTDPGWSAILPTSYTTTNSGTVILYAWAKDKAGNVSAAGAGTSDAVAIDIQRPVVDTFTVTSPTSTLTVPLLLTATDDTGVTGYMVTTTSAAPSASDAGWAGAAPTSYTFTTAGTYALFAWAKDGAGNVSLAKTASVVIDLTNPVVSAFTLATPVNSTSVPVTAFTATDTGGSGLAAYLITESPTVPLASDVGWSTSKPASYTVLGAWASGSKTLYAWAKDGVGNVSPAKTSAVVLDTAPPAVSAFTVAVSAPNYVNNPKISITTLVAADDLGGTGLAAYMITESNVPPLESAVGWSATKPTTYTTVNVGAVPLYAWVKDKAGNISAAFAPQMVNIDITGPTVDSFTATTPFNNTTVPITAFTASDLGGSTVAGYLVTSTATPPLATAVGWSVTPQTSYTFTAAGSYTLYAWVKDGAGNVSASIVKQAVVVDLTRPLMSKFTLKTPVNSTVNVPVTVFTATDTGGSGLAAYLITESATAPLASDPGWGPKPTSYTVQGAWASGTIKTLYGWVMNGVGNISLAKTASVLLDTVVPTVSGFSVAANINKLTVPITFAATDVGTGLAGYMITESPDAPLINAVGWLSKRPTSYTTTVGAKTLYAWAKDKAGNVSSAGVGTSGVVNIDITKPTVTAFTLTSVARNIPVPVATFTATDDLSGVAAYLITTSATTPSVKAKGWKPSAPAVSQAFSTAGTKTLYGWAKDNAGNISLATSTTVVITP